jgi:hypothetical protein
MRIDINIVVSVPDITPEQHAEFVEGVMETFRKVFPEAEPLPKMGMDTPAPVTVTFHSEGES